MQPSRPIFPLALFTALLLVLLTPAVAFLQSGNVTVQITEPDTGSYPQVKMTAAVVDRYGIAIPNLTKDNFIVQQDNQTLPANVSGFSDPNLNVAVCLAFDTSASMSGKPLQDAKDAAKAFLDKLGPNDLACLVSFSGKVDINNPPVIDPAREVNFTADKNAIKNVIDGLKAEGGTALYDASVKAIKLTSTQSLGTRAVIVFTDGQDCGDLDCKNPASISTPDRPMALAKENQIPVYTIGFGKQIDSKYLLRLADETGGSYQQTPDSNNLTQLFENLATQLKTRYAIEYTSPLSPDENQHNIHVTVKTPLGQAESTTKFAPILIVQPFLRIFEGTGAERQELRNGQTMRGTALIAPEIKVGALRTISTTTFIIDGTEYADIEKPFTHAWNTCNSPTGPHTLTVRAQGDQLQVGEATVSVVTISSGIPCLIEVLSPEAKIGIGGLALLALLAVLALVLFTRRRRKPEPQPVPITTYPQYPPPDTPIAGVATPYTPVSPEPAPPPAVDKTSVIRPGGEYPPPASTGGNQTVIIHKGKSAGYAFLVMEKGSHSGRNFPIGSDGAAIGRSGENDIVVDDPMVSRKQARIKFEDNALYLYDLASTNPTKVNGKSLRDRYKLEENDRIQMGETVFVFKQVKSESK